MKCSHTDFFHCGQPAFLCNPLFPPPWTLAPLMNAYALLDITLPINEHYPVTVANISNTSYLCV